MDILKLIKERRTIRKYKNKPIPKKIIDKIIEAGIWGPSIIIFQPWKIVVVTKKSVIRKIYNIIEKKSKNLDIAGRIALRSTKIAISGCQLLIAVYKTEEFTKFRKKIPSVYSKITTAAEISAISAAIQNMLLVAESLKLGSCWLDTPLLYDSEINKILEVKNKLMAILTFGYPDEKGKRVPRKSIFEFLVRME